MPWLWIIIVGLAVAWVVLWRRGARPASSEISPRVQERAELVSRANQAWNAGWSEQAQALELEVAWLKTDPPPHLSSPPELLDPHDYRHMALVDEIRERYAAALRDQSGPFGACAFKPASALPFPKEAIAQSLQLLIDVGEGRASSEHLDSRSLTPDVVKTIDRCAQLLNTFLDVPPDQLPSDPDQNAKFGAQFRLS